MITLRNDIKSGRDGMTTEAIYGTFKDRDERVIAMSETHRSPSGLARHEASSV
jgi:hypothetical protein